MKKRLLALLLGTAMAATLLAGCGSSSSSTTTETTEEEAEETEEEAAEETEEAEEASDTASAGDEADLPDASGDPAITIVFSGASFTAMYDAEEVFTNMVNELSGGSITIDWHPNNELGDDLNIITSVSTGDIDMGVTSPAAVTTMLPNLSLFDAYYIITDQQTAYDVMDGEIGDALEADAEELNMKLVGWCENGFRNLTVAGREVNTLEDLSGLKIRMMQNTLQMAAWSALGTNPTPMAFTEVFTALQQGTIDAQENPLGLISSNSFMDVQDHLVITQHVYTPMIIYMNMDKYNSMTDAQKEVFDYCMDYMVEWERQHNIETNEEILATFEEEGVDVVYLDDSVIADFQTAIQEAGVYDQVRDAMADPELFDQLLEVCGVTLD
ncbi:MAG: TRAP transporter substrate-binding protein [Lachnospiraceae bacterium]|nr:TRAP transporter substrate-binding protein [Lachnospiraceae bacterium]